MKLSKSAWSAAALSASVLLSAPGQVVAQSAAAQSMLEEIVVTARRREETLADLPLSVAAMSADAMEAQGIYNIDQIGDFVPNLTFTNSDRRHVKAVYIRGIGNDSPVSIRPSGTGMYLDGQYLPNTMGQMMSTVDIDRVEVLRGPQGTLFGKNTTGGAINIVTTKPTDEFEADIMMRVGDHGQQDFKGVINIPFSDVLAGRFSVISEQMSGHFYNQTLKKDVGAIDVQGFGAAFRFTPNDNWMIDFSARGNYQDDDDEGVQCRVAPSTGSYNNMVTQHGAAAVKAASGGLTSGVAGGVNQWGGSNGNGIVGHVDRMYKGATLAFWNDCTSQQSSTTLTSQEKDTYLRLNNEFLNLTTAWDSNGEIGIFDNLNVRTILAGQRTDLWYLADRDGSSLSIDALGGTAPRGLRRQTTSGELLITADVSERMSFTTGYHYFDDENQAGQRDSNGCLAIFERNKAAIIADKAAASINIRCYPDGGGQFDRLADKTSAGGPGISGRDGYEVTASDGVFAHMTYQLTDDWTLDTGLRWTQEHRIFHQLEFPLKAGTCNHKAGAVNSAPSTGLCNPEYWLSYASTMGGGFYNNAELFFEETTPMVSLTRNLGGGDTLEDGMLYVSYSEGFLAGSFNDELNVTLEPALAPLLSYDPEHVKNYEIGFKGTFMDGGLRISTAAFFMDYTNKQETVSIDNADGRFGPDASIEVTSNASTVDIFGLELEVRATTWEGGFMTLDVGWLDNKYGAYEAFDATTGLTVDRSDLTIKDYSPEWTVNASIEHVFELASGASITPRLGMYFQTEYDYVTGISPTVDSICMQDAYLKLRGRVTYLPADGNWQASAYGSNLTDEVYFEICGKGRSGVMDYRYGDPKTVGVEFQYFWGE
jgi:iron complex outermembrane receptor protein